MKSDKATPLLIVIAVLLIANLAATAWVAVKVSSPSTHVSGEQPGEVLPDFITKDVKKKIFNDFQAAYNSGSHDAFYNLFSDLAKAQIDEEALGGTHDQLLSSLGKVEDGVYSHYNYVQRQGNLKVFVLYYAVKLPDSLLGNAGEVKITISVDDEEYGILGAHLFSNSQG
ncbi:hypothetical protein SAMN02745216_02859 [Desulfatibacillum alkenivorans DSM 16219]|jgi:hypothetical protein|uniref:DUF3887 domain-containing protein n=1 Tax=Desulfatibacillum alkenivorans DSM 16219 TaxID=1121393 RepID=A0A1M6PP34_9BACT|nr:hypothetical protein [Desulfatibacillum alkenivorans]SHK09689.1 hypothetical protein SAMN02745216_02859 [Desulfatibacillum alkenivorans DSM 16219]